MKFLQSLLPILTVCLSACDNNSSNFSPERGADIAANAQINYQRNCAVCHGVVGQRQIGRTTLRDSLLSPEEVKAVIENGRTPMPGFSEKFSHEELDEIIEYVISLRRS